MTISFYLVQDDKDIQLLTDIAQEIWHEYFPCIISDAQIEYMIEQYQSVSALTKQIKDGGYCYQILYCDDIPAGYFGVCMQDDGSLFLSKLYLKQQFRGRGLASIQFQEILRIAKEKHATSVWLTVNKNNEQAIAVYQHFRMKCIREQVSDIGDGFVMDDYVFSLLLES